MTGSNPLAGWRGYCRVVVTAALLMAADGAIAQEHATGSGYVSPEEYATFPTPPTYRAYLPVGIDLSAFFPPPESQGQQPSCGPWAVGYAARAYYAEAAESRPIQSKANIPSPAFLYNLATSKRDCSTGTNLPAVMTLLQKGAPSLEAYPYDDDACPLPSLDLVRTSTDFRIDRFEALPLKAVDEAKGQLALGNPVIVDILPDDNFDKLAGKDIWDAGPIPGHNLHDSGHAVTLVGYDETKQAFKLINSWGDDWGDKGFGYLSFDTYRNRVRGAYVMHLAGLSPPVPHPTLFDPPAPPPDPVPPPAPGPGPAPTPPVSPPDAIISGLTCGKVQLYAKGDGYAASGFVGSAKDLDKIRTQLGAKLVEDQIEIRPWPQCEALLTLDNELAAPDASRPAITIAATDLKAGDPFTFEVTAPDFGGYLHVAYIAADGSVSNLQQVTPSSLETAAPGAVQHFGTTPKFTVSAPFGDEMLLVIASKSPLFSAPRPGSETERDFLTSLRKAILSRPNEAAETRFVSAAYVAIQTHDKVAQ